MDQLKSGQRMKQATPKARKNQPVIGKWTARGYINTDDKREPIKNQGAIGSGRRRVSVGSTYNMI